MALRPRSLGLVVGPVAVGVALAGSRTGVVDPWLAGLALAAALLMQLITNLQNDVGFTLRGGEASGRRVGLPRATAQGWLPVQAVQRAVWLLSALAVALGLVLVALRGWPVLALGVASLLAALAYMGGPRPIAYTPFGELTVLVFFGGVAVLGTEWLLSGAIGPASVPVAMALGSLAAATLAVNNHRDREHDAQVGRRTFVVCFGDRASMRAFGLLLLAPFALLPLAALAAGNVGVLLPLLLLPSALRLRRDFGACAPGVAYNALLFRCFALGPRFAGLLVLGLVMDGLARSFGR